MAEEFQKPDPYLLAALNGRVSEVQKAYVGVSHQANMARADADECWKAIMELREQNAALLKDREADRAKIGELQTANSELTKRIDIHAKFLDELRNERKKQGKVA